MDKDEETRMMLRYIRRLGPNRMLSNVNLYMDVFGVGLTAARDRCRELELDPYSKNSYKINHTKLEE
jgi:hypothetical protein